MVANVVVAETKLFAICCIKSHEPVKRFVAFCTFATLPFSSFDMHFRYSIRIAFLTICLMPCLADADDWARFRGPNGSGVSKESVKTPTRWSNTENLKWKFALPGPGSSSPIVVGNNVFVTCWTGYGIDHKKPGDQNNLRRHLICVNRSTGQQRWSAEIKPKLPEDKFDGRFAENGYATHTPVSDGKLVFAFFGKSGVVAFDLDGKKQWDRDVGNRLHDRSWGSAASPIIYKDKLIVPAFVESNSLWALDKTSGEVAWKEHADGFADTWSTPVIAKGKNGDELVIGVPYEVWAFDPNTGVFKWYCESVDSNSMCASVVANEQIIYAVGGRNSGSVAIKTGGKGDVTNTHVQWRGRDRARISTPLIHDGMMYWVNNSIANCISIETGEKIYQHRLPPRNKIKDAQQENGDQLGEGVRDERRRQRRARSADYASLVAADGKLYHTARDGTVYVFKTGKSFNVIAQNKFAKDKGDFSATPAISNGEIFIRSSKYLYCVTEKK